MASEASQALLLMDFQKWVVDRFPGSQVLEAAVRAIAAARAHGVAVIFVQVAFRPGYPDVSPTNRGFSALAGVGQLAEDDPATGLHEALGVASDDIVVVKKRVSAFAGSDLEVVLRSGGTTSLVLTGIATSGVVLSTLREAADRDYRLTVLRDACADADEEVSRVLFEKVFPRQAEILTVTEWAACLDEAPLQGS